MHPRAFLIPPFFKLNPPFLRAPAVMSNFNNFLKDEPQWVKRLDEKTGKAVYTR